MDINLLRGLSTVFMLVAFLGICWWAFGPKRRKKFEEAARLPFADEESTHFSADDRDVEHSNDNKKQG